MYTPLQDTESSTNDRHYINTINGSEYKSAESKVLLVAYFRGGSTLLGETFNRNPKAFYWFEPLNAAVYDFTNHAETKGQPYIRLENETFM